MDRWMDGVVEVHITKLRLFSRNIYKLFILRRPGGRVHMLVFYIDLHLLITIHKVPSASVVSWVKSVDVLA